jgi:hypothetical protein
VEYIKRPYCCDINGSETVPIAVTFRLRNRFMKLYDLIWCLKRQGIAKL